MTAVTSERIQELRAAVQYDPDREGSVDALIAYKDACEDELARSRAEAIPQIVAERAACLLDRLADIVAHSPAWSGSDATTTEADALARTLHGVGRGEVVERTNVGAAMIVRHARVARADGGCTVAGTVDVCRAGWAQVRWDDGTGGVYATDRLIPCAVDPTRILDDIHHAVQANSAADAVMEVCVLLARTGRTVL